MTDFSDFCAAIADYANRQDWSPVLVASFVRDAEQKLNAELRVDRMINTVTGLIAADCAPLPLDWLESDLVLIANVNAPTGWSPIEYQPRAEFFRTPSTPYSTWQYKPTTYGRYTIEGRQIFFGGPPDTVNGTNFQISYYAEVPVFSDANPSWVYTKYPSLYRYAALMHADLHAVGEEQNAANMKQLCEDMIQKLNADHYRSRASGSRLARGHKRSFG